MRTALFLVAAILAASSLFAESEAELRSSTLVVGKVSNNPAKHYRYLKPMADYLASKMEDLGIQRARIKMASDDAQMVHFLKTGQVDLVTESLMPSALYRHYANAEPIAIKWKKGVETYHSIIVVRKDSGIETLNDLRNKTFAFEDPGSTTAFYLPAEKLLNSGLILEKLNRPGEKPSEGKIGYLFSFQEINSSTWVYRKKVDAIAISNLDWNKDDHLPSAFRKHLRIIYRSNPIPRTFELVRPDLEALRKQRLTSLLLNTESDPDAAQALDSYQKTARFSAVEKSHIEYLEQALDTIRYVRGELQ